MASAVHLAALRVSTGVSFHEVFLGVPCRVAQSRVPVLFVPLMYCDEPVSRWVGNTLYGFNKWAARMEWVGQVFVVTSSEGALMLRARIGDPQSKEASSHRAIRAILDYGRLPVVGRRSDHTLITSGFDWVVGSGARAVRCAATIDATALGAASAGKARVQANRTFRFDGLTWRITWPTVLAPESNFRGPRDHHASHIADGAPPNFPER